MNRRGWALVSGTVLVLCLLFLWRFVKIPRSSPPTPEAERSGRLAVATVVARARQAPAPPSAAASTPTPAPDAAPAARDPESAGSPTPASGKLGAQVAQDYRRRAQYPRWSVGLPDGAPDPILKDREVTVQAARGPGDVDPTLVLFPDQVSFEVPDRAVLFAYLSRNGIPVPAARIRADVRDIQANVVASLTFADDGRSPDVSADDFVYTAELDPASIANADGSYFVVVKAASPEGDERTGTTGFLFSRPDARLDGRYEEKLEDGNLRIDVGVEVSAPGRFHVEGTLYTEGGKLLGWAQGAALLAPGPRFIPLRFYGLLFHEHQAPGPYVLRYLALSTATRMPNAKNKLAEDVFTTSPWGLDGFAAQPFNDPNLLDTADRLEGGSRTRP